MLSAQCLGPVVATVWHIIVWQEHVVDSATVLGVCCAGWPFHL